MDRSFVGECVEVFSYFFSPCHSSFVIWEVAHFLSFSFSSYLDVFPLFFLLVYPCFFILHFVMSCLRVFCPAFFELF